MFSFDFIRDYNLKKEPRRRGIGVIQFYISFLKNTVPSIRVF